MADPCTICTSSSTYENIFCSPPQAGILAFQPKYQVLPDGRVVNNPCYDNSINKSFWTYKFFTEYSNDNTVSGIDSLIIPVYSGIQNNPMDTITVEERIDGWGQFKHVEFSLNNADPNFGAPPSGFLWLKIDNPSSSSSPKRYDRGVCVEYRIAITGDFQAAAQAIRAKAGHNNLTFCGADTSFLVPGHPSAGELNITQTCSTLVANNMAKLHYKVTVTNTGSQALTNVNYNDVITFNSDLITLSNATITTSQPNVLSASLDKGRITVSGVIPEIDGGEGSFSATYDIPVTHVTSPGQLTVDNTLTASSGRSVSSTSCTAVVPVVKLKGEKCSTITNSNRASFITKVSSMGVSPPTSVNIIDQLIIPLGVTVRFTASGLGQFTALYADTNAPVDLNTDISDKVINIVCEGINVPSGGTEQRVFQFTIVSTSVFQSPAKIIDTTQLIIGRTLNQVFMLPEGLPAAASIDVACCTRCSPECS